MWVRDSKEPRGTPLVQWRWGWGRGTKGEIQVRRCIGVGFNPSSALEEAGVTQIETNWLFALTISLVLFTVSRK